MELFQILDEGERERIRYGGNPYRALFRGGAGLTAYCCSLPLFTEKKTLLSRRWREKDGRAVCSGCDAAVSETPAGVRLENACGAAEISLEEGVSLFPSVNGVTVLKRGNQLRFSVRTKEAAEVSANGACVAWMRERFVPFLTVSGLFGRSPDGYVPLSLTETAAPDGIVLIETRCADADEILCEINLYAPKLMLDTTVCSRYPDRNNAFGGTAFCGRTEALGEQRLYLRFSAAAFEDLKGYLVEEAWLYLPVFYGAGALAARRLNGPWCSFDTTWNHRPEEGAALPPPVWRGKFLAFNVGALIRDQLRIRDAQDFGLAIIPAAETGFCVLATGDNYCRPPLLKIRLAEN